MSLKDEIVGTAFGAWLNQYLGDWSCEYSGDIRAMRAAWDAAVAAERERCAGMCEETHAELDKEFSPDGCTDGALVAADRIRALNEPAPG